MNEVLWNGQFTYTVDNIYVQDPLNGHLYPLGDFPTKHIQVGEDGWFESDEPYSNKESILRIKKLIKQKPHMLPVLLTHENRYIRLIAKRIYDSKI